MSIKKRCCIKGDGKVIVLIHGMGGPIVWEPISDLLSKHFKLIIPVFPGYLPEDGYIDYKDDFYVDFLEKLRIEMELDELNLVGLSMGARTAINYAIRHVGRVSTLTILNGVGLGNISPAFSTPIIKNVFPWLLCRILANPKNMIRLGSEDFVNKDSEVFKKSTECFIRLMSSDNVRANFTNILVKVGVANKEWKNELPKINIPTLILWGSDDKTAPVKWAYQLQGLIKDSKLNILDGFRHMAVMEKPKYFAERIVEFLR